MCSRITPILLAISVLALASCRRDKDDPIDLDYTSATDNAKADDAFTDMLSQVDNAVDANGLRELCDPTVTFDTIAMPHTMTVDFGTANCTATNGRQRRGRIEVSYTGRYREPGTVITLTPQGYFVNDNQVQGSKTVTNLGLDANGHLHYSIAVNGSLTAADGSWTATHQAQRTRTWIEGSDTPQLVDDVYLITGGGSGVNRNGAAYTVSITSALRVALSCAWITQGTVQITPANRPVRTIDYGSGSCDGSFSVNVNGQTFTVNIG